MSTQYEKMQERLALEWTSTPPTVPGAYYAWSPKQGVRIVHLELGRSPSTHPCIQDRIGWMRLDAILHAGYVTQWYGPIELPAPPKGQS